MMKKHYKTLLLLFLCVKYTVLFGQNPYDPKKIDKSSYNQHQYKSSHTAATGPKQPQKFSLNSSDYQLIIPQSDLTKTDNTTPKVRNCYTVESEQKLRERFPKRISKEGFEQNLAAYISRNARMVSSDEQIYKIPTIVHVVHNGEPLGTGSNISKEQVMSQFDALNEDFRRLGAGYNEHPDGADINIEFVPVLVDPEGNLLEEPGIDRVFGYNAYYEYNPIELELKPNTIWDPERYFNIWVLKFGGSYAGILGYAQFPTLSGLEGLPNDGADFTDGVVIGYQYFGRTENVMAPFNQGRTATHEVGHWLGLRHIWGDGDCSADDYCADTPNADGPNHTCDFRDSCPGGAPDMIENYMDYSDDGCMSIFTNDQRTRIRTVLNASPRRKSLIACQLALQAQVGNNTADQLRSWYEYTATEDQVVTISSIGTTELDTKLSIYKTCNALPMFVSDNEQGTAQSEVILWLTAGESVKFVWEASEYFESFNWTLSTSEQSTGVTCQLAALASEGTNTVAATPLHIYWYKFTSTSDNQKVTIDGNGMQFQVYGNSCDQLVPLRGSNSSATIYDLSANETIFIAFNAAQAGFSWTLTSEDGRTGESCGDALVAVEGVNTVPYAAPFEYWYTYTIEADGKINISTDNPEMARLSVFKACKGFKIVDTDGEQIKTDVHLKAGETITLKWTVETGSSNFSWALEKLPYSNGEICSIAKEAKYGVNHADAAPQWFAYTTTKATNLKITSVGHTEVNTHLIVKRECDGPITAQNDDVLLNNEYYMQSQLLLYGLAAGETVYILWSEKWDYEGFDWSIEEVDPLPGDHCTSAKQAVVGENVIEYRPDHYSFGHHFWTKYTVPADGKTITASSKEYINMAMYINNGCETFTWVDGGVSKSKAVGLPAGTEIIIVWSLDEVKQDQKWELSVEDIAPGDNCDNPIRAELGQNVAASSPVWYDYVMSQRGSLKIKYENYSPGDNPLVAILKGCDISKDILYVGDTLAFVSGLEEGQHVSIYWNMGYPYPGITWSLEEVPFKTGDSCDDPITANYGLNHAEYATQWFTYTAPSAGNFVISSRAFTFENTNLYVYDGCNGNLLASSDNVYVPDDYIEYFQSEVLLEGIQEGQTILIKWAGKHSIYPFDWEIVSDQPRPGDSCENPLAAVEGVNNGMRPMPAWFTFTMPKDGALTLSTLGIAETNTQVEVYDGCDGNLLGSNDDGGGESQSYVRIEDLKAGQTVLIRWANMFPSEKYTFNWQLLVGDPEPGLFCDFPSQAQEGVNTVPAYSSNFYWYTFTMPEDNKKLVIKRLTVPNGHYRTIGVTADCDRFNDYGLADDTLQITGLVKGEQVRIFFGELTTKMKQSFDWELIVADMEEGDECDKAVEVSPGIYNATGAVTWYEFTVPRDANVRIASAGLNGNYGPDTYLEVYDGCNGNLIAQSDNPDDWSHLEAEVLIENAKRAQTLWIKWSTNMPFQVPFRWRLAVEGVENTPPTLADASFTISSTSGNGYLIGRLEAEDADGDNLIYKIVGGNNDGAFMLDRNGELRISDASKISGERTLAITVSDNIAASVAVNVHIGVVTGIDKDVSTAIQVYPNPVKDKLYLMLDSQLKVHQSYIVDINGRLVRVNQPDERTIDVSSFKPGVYILKLVTNKGQHAYKISVGK